MAFLLWTWLFFGGGRFFSPLSSILDVLIQILWHSLPFREFVFSNIYTFRNITIVILGFIKKFRMEFGGELFFFSPFCNFKIFSYIFILVFLVFILFGWGGVLYRCLMICLFIGFIRKFRNL